MITPAGGLSQRYTIVPVSGTVGNGAFGSSTSGGIVVSLGMALMTGLGAAVVGGDDPPGSGGNVVVVVVGAAVVVGDPGGGGSSPLTSLARHSLPGRYKRTALRASSGAAGQSSKGSGATAGSMNAPQILAG